MSCDDGTCGTGGWGGPLPGDPSNNSVLSATPAFGGIDITWTLPTVNGYAVSYARLYRALISDFGAATVLVDAAGGSFYYDKVAPNITYYYWLQFVSINGTVGEVIGPVYAQARDSIANTIEQLTGRIDAGVLAQSLKTEIAKIGTNAQDIFQEIQDRLGTNAALAAAMAQVQAHADEAMTFVLTETTQRVTQNEAFVDSFNLLYGQAAGNAAAILSEQQIRVSADEALAQDILEIRATVGEGTSAAIKVETDARVAADSALATQITTAQSTLNGNISQVQTNLQTNINTVNGKVTSIGALYTAKVTVNGLIGGFGIYNDGTSVEAGFDVDTFWIGRTQANKRKPFIVVGGEVFIDQAVINSLVFTKLRDESGSVMVENGKLKANYISTTGIVISSANGNTLDMNTVDPDGTTKLNNRGINVLDPNGVIRVELGKLS